jgi:hypothetical protein
VTYSFVSMRIEKKLNVLPNKMEKRLVISTPLKETVDIDRVYKVFFYDNRGNEMWIDLLPL